MQKSRIRTLAATGAGLLVAAAGIAATSAPVEAAAGYAPADTAEIHPGTMMYTDGAQCTANFVYTDGAGNTYVGYAAHCAGTGAATDTDGCSTPVPAAGHQGDLQRGRQPGRRGHPGRHRHARLQQLADHAEERREGHQHLRLQRPRPGEGRQPRTSARSTRPCRSGAARPASTPTVRRPATGSTPTATPASAPGSSSSSRTPVRASATTRPTAAGRTRSTPSRRASPVTRAAGS